ncbi:hypothetical protein MKW94_009085 [Papaver nudicaule]|uniref:Uncharacterized protein n=1 Tax=Papaver nudicaule TaxID=74823 RepID=A0AA41RZE8_PAPNU|nr:hypothetical protein [Papaver nudicaule]
MLDSATTCILIDHQRGYNSSFINQLILHIPNFLSNFFLKLSSEIEIETLSAADDSVAVVAANTYNISTTTEERYDGEKNKEAIQFIEEVTINADEVQMKVLTEILSCNAQAEYLQRHGLDGHTDRQTFKRVIPVVTCEDLQPDIDRLINKGNVSSILCTSPISQFIRSTGTSSGVSKLIPLTEEQREKSSHFRSLLMPLLNQHISGLGQGKAMHLYFASPCSKTPGGLISSTLTTSIFKSSDFKNLFSSIDPYRNYTSPLETILCEDTYQSLYSQLLCGLYQSKQVLRLAFTFASGFIEAVKCLQQHWTLICDDIRAGTIAVDHPRITDPAVKNAVMKILDKPNPQLADFIESECKRDLSWEGIVSRLWPNVKCVDTIITGTMSHHIPNIDFYSNGLPIVSTMYVCSECFLGINLDPLTSPSEVSYTLIPTMYFEFLPVLDENDFNKAEEQHGQKLVDLVEVELGKEYELVLTNYAGLYRYRVGDVLRVAGFKNNAPHFNFMRRTNVVLSIDTEKTNEYELQNAVKQAADHLMKLCNVSLAEYTSFADTSTNPGHYVLYWELQCNDIYNASSIPHTVFEECGLIVEEFLGYEYRNSRAKGSLIGPLEIKIVETGTFGKLMDHAINQGTSVTQYKTPRCMKLGPRFELLNSMVLSSFFSTPRCPQAQL